MQISYIDTIYILKKEPRDLTKIIHNKPKIVSTNGVYSHVGDFTYHYRGILFYWLVGHSPATYTPKRECIHFPLFSKIFLGIFISFWDIWQLLVSLPSGRGLMKIVFHLIDCINFQLTVNLHIWIYPTCFLRTVTPF